jgi:hypothetical protein
MDVRDLGFKVFWTALSAVLGVAVVALTDAPYAWAPVAVAAVNAALILVRQKTGETSTA